MVAKTGNGATLSRPAKVAAAKTLLATVEADAARAAIDVNKWTAARMHPKAFGDKVAVEATGKDAALLPAAGGATVIVMYDNGRDPPHTPIETRLTGSAY
jgi:hypothetical protein